MVLPIIAVAGRAVAGAAKAGVSAAGKAAAGAARSGASAAKSGAQAAASGTRSAARSGARRTSSLRQNLGNLGEKRLGDQSLLSPAEMENQLNINRAPRSMQNQITSTTDVSQSENETNDSSPSEVKEEEEASDTGSAEATETALSSQKSQAQNGKSGAATQAAEQLLEGAAKQYLKKSIYVWALPALGTAIFWIIIGLLVSLILFVFVMAYKCWNESGLISKGIMFYQYMTDDVEGVFNKVFSGTCGVTDTPAPKPDDTSSETEEQSSLPEETAQ